MLWILQLTMLPMNIDLSSVSTVVHLHIHLLNSKESQQVPCVSSAMNCDLLVFFRQKKEQSVIL